MGDPHSPRVIAPQGAHGVHSHAITAAKSPPGQAALPPFKRITTETQRRADPQRTLVAQQSGHVVGGQPILKSKKGLTNLALGRVEALGRAQEHQSGVLRGNRTRASRMRGRRQMQGETNGQQAQRQRQGNAAPTFGETE